MDDHEAKIDLGIVGLGPAEHIGRGGFADVYRAEQLSLRRTVAVKVLRAQASDADAEARFERECHAIGAVSDHPHIVGVHEGGFTRNGRAYLVMEYLPGGSLYERLVDDGPLPVPEIVDIGIKIGKALAVAHRTGVLHRDVKPANIMISAYGEPALGDFGIARVEGGHQTATGMVTASFAHAAPEVLEGHPSTAAADIYSLGSTIFELMTGQPPYYNPADESIWPLMKRILSEPMPSPESVGMSPQLGAIFRKATARDVGERYQDADDVVNDLIDVASDPLAVTVYPPASGGFVPAPRPPGGRKGKEAKAGLPIGVPEWLPPPAKPDLTLLPSADGDGAAAANADRETMAFSDQRSDAWASGADGDVNLEANPDPDWKSGAADPEFDAESEIGRQPDLAPSAESAVGEQPDSTEVIQPDWRASHPDLFGPDDPPDTALWSAPSPSAAAPTNLDPYTGKVSPRVLAEPTGQVPATTMDLPPDVVPRSSAPSSGRRLLPVIGLVAAAAALIGGLFVFTDLGDPILDAVNPDSDTPGVTDGDLQATGDTRIELQQASVGPLLEGDVYEVTLTNTQPGASVQLILDGLASGQPIEVGADGVVRFEAPAGRHSVTVEARTDDEVEISNTIGFYGLSAAGPSEGYRATLASIATTGPTDPTDPTGTAWSDALANYDRLAGDGHGPLELIVSDDAPTLTPGYWTVSVTGFGNDGEAAEDYCRQSGLATPTDCYVSFVNASLS